MNAVGMIYLGVLMLSMDKKLGSYKQSGVYINIYIYLKIHI